MRNTNEDELSAMYMRAFLGVWSGLPAVDGHSYTDTKRIRGQEASPRGLEDRRRLFSEDVCSASETLAVVLKEFP